MFTILHYQPVVERPEAQRLPGEIQIALGKHIFEPAEKRRAHMTQYDQMWPETERCLTKIDIPFLEGLRDGFFDSRHKVSEGVQKLIDAIEKWGTVQVWTEERDPSPASFPDPAAYPNGKLKTEGAG